MSIACCSRQHSELMKPLLLSQVRIQLKDLSSPLLQPLIISNVHLTRELTLVSDSAYKSKWGFNYKRSHQHRELMKPLLWSQVRIQPKDLSSPSLQPLIISNIHLPRELTLMSDSAYNSKWGLNYKRSQDDQQTVGSFLNALSVLADIE